MGKQREWPWVVGLASAGALDSLYLLMYQTKRVDRLVCPVFGEGCEQVASSPVAYPKGIPDAVFGVAGYSLAAVTAVAVPRTRGKVQKMLAAGVIGGSVLAVGLSAFLTYAQPRKTGAWCFWCLLSATISAAMAPVAVSGALKVLRDE